MGSSTIGLVSIIAIFVVPIVVTLVWWRDLFFRSSPARIILYGGLSPPEKEQYFGACVRRTRGFLNIVAGEAHSAVYTKRIGAILDEMARENGVKIRLICGPVLMVDEERHSIVLELAKKLLPNGEPVVQLYCSPKRKGVHFRISGNGHVYWELPHEPGQFGRRIGIDYARNFYELKRFSRRFEQLIKKGELARSLVPEQDFLFLDEEGLEKLNSEIKERGRDFNEYSKEELEKVALECEIPIANLNVPGNNRTS